MAEVHGLREDDAVLMPAPLAHVSGLLNGVLLPGIVPMKSVLMARWDPEEALTLIERERITFMIGPPTFFVSLMDARGFRPERVETLRLVSSGGAGVTPAFVDEAAARLGCVVKRTYGSTEAPTITTSQPGDEPARARDTDGRPTGTVELRLDATTGELQVRGPELFSGYTDPAADVDAFTNDGWFRTGDLATIDGAGWLTIVGRIKDIIIRGGENIAAAEVESVLEAHPAVRQAVAVGEPDARLGERVVAFVITDGPFDLEACRSWFAAQGTARYKTPERVVVVDALPLLAAGKPDRAALRNLARR
jgi:cyclohexanecarboxylate-CoA ligase